MSKSQMRFLSRMSGSLTSNYGGKKSKPHKLYLNKKPKKLKTVFKKRRILFFQKKTLLKYI